MSGYPIPLHRFPIGGDCLSAVPFGAGLKVGDPSPYRPPQRSRFYLDISLGLRSAGMCRFAGLYVFRPITTSWADDGTERDESRHRTAGNGPGNGHTAQRERTHTDTRTEGSETTHTDTAHTWTQHSETLPCARHPSIATCTKSK